MRAGGVSSHPSPESTSAAVISDDRPKLSKAPPTSAIFQRRLPLRTSIDAAVSNDELKDIFETRPIPFAPYGEVDRTQHVGSLDFPWSLGMRSCKEVG